MLGVLLPRGGNASSMYTSIDIGNETALIEPFCVVSQFAISCDGCGLARVLVSRYRSSWTSGAFASLSLKSIAIQTRGEEANAGNSTTSASYQYSPRIE